MEKKTKNKNNSEVLELEAEEVPLEKQIDNTLVKNNVTEAVIAGLKEKYGELRLRDIDDKETYLEISDARKDVRKYGILAEKICKAGREDAIKIQKLWLSKQAEVLGKIAEVQDPLDAEINKYEREVERKELEAAQRREEAYTKRTETIVKMGAHYDNGSFVLNHISYEATLVKECDDDIWNETILPKYKREYENNESARVAEEKKRDEEAARMKVEREAFELQQKQFKEQQEAFVQQQSLATQIIQEQKRNKMIARGNQLAALGMTFDFQKNAYVYQDISVDNTTEVGMWSDKEWDDLINKIEPIIEDRKADMEVKRQEEIKEREQEAVDRAVAEEKEKQNKLADQIEIDRKRAEAAKSEELAKATDKIKWEHFITSLKGIIAHEYKSSLYKRRHQIAKEKIEEIINL